MTRFQGTLFPVLACALLIATAEVTAAVTVTEDTITLPTYRAGAPEPSPIFYFGRTSQGAEGRVYPYPLYDSLTHERTERSYRIIYLENEYVRIGVLPEIGGRLFEAVDKTNGYDFVYRQHVVKPALIGLIGAWMSGGIEWNIPHHHRASTFLPVQYEIEKNADGSKTIWVGELELRQRMRWAVGYTLTPGKCVLTAKVRIVNRTPHPQSMLCFANVAVHASDDYQILFPPDTRFVTYHHKTEFATWPIATGTYRSSDFGEGTDVSRYANHHHANSMFAWNYTSDFFAGYDHGRGAGTMSVADHHQVPGKKFWTWGSGPRGRMWDKILTDDDGPYIELMTGAFSDNQPDYSWMQPFETRAFEMHWYPFRDIGGVKEANLDAAVNLELSADGRIEVGFYTTAAHSRAQVRVTAGERVLLDAETAIDPANPFVRQLAAPTGLEATALRASLLVDGLELVAYSPAPLEPFTLPEPVTDPPDPEAIETAEELYLTGLRIDQFHDADREPEPYWEEALRRDPGHTQTHTALAIRQLKQARFAEAETHLRAALERLTHHYTMPLDGAAFYYLGLALRAQEKTNEAFEFLHKATWSAAWQGPAYFTLAEIATARRDLASALKYTDRALEANALHLRALTLRAALLRHSGRLAEAATTLQFAALSDPLDPRILAEHALTGDSPSTAAWARTLQDHPAAVLEVAVEYGNAGLWSDGMAILAQLRDASDEPNQVSPLVDYFHADFAERLGDAASAKASRALARTRSPEYAFPFQAEVLPVLERAMAADPSDARAAYYLGNLLFDWQPKRAVEFWERAATLEPELAMAQRNLAIAYQHKPTLADPAQAIARLEQAVSVSHPYALHFAELDALYSATGKPPAKRLALLAQHPEVVAQSDDALSRAIGLKIFAGQCDEAIQWMSGRIFSVWEGGTLSVTDHWISAHLRRGREHLTAERFAGARNDFQAAATIPDNLPSDRRGGGSRAAEIHYWNGLTHAALGESDQAVQAWRQALLVTAPKSRRRSTERPGELPAFSIQACYQAMSQQQLGETAEAETALHQLLDAAHRALGEASSSDARVRAHYVAGLAARALGAADEAKASFHSALASQPDHLGAQLALTLD